MHIIQYGTAKMEFILDTTSSSSTDKPAKNMFSVPVTTDSNSIFLAYTEYRLGRIGTPTFGDESQFAFIYGCSP